MKEYKWLDYREFLVQKELQELRERVVFHELMKEEKYRDLFIKLLKIGYDKEK